MGLKITGTGHALPERSVSNNELAAFLDTSDEWIVGKTGIKSRFICTDENLGDLAVRAAEAALKDAETEPGQLDYIICSTIGAEYVTPALACLVAAKLGAGCPAFDINAACAGFVYALDTAAAYLTGNAKHILIVSAERMSSYVDWTDRRVSVLFGDGAGACVVINGGALKYSKLLTNGNLKLIYIEAGSGGSPFAAPAAGKRVVHMDGPEVFKFAVQTIERETRAALLSLDMTPDDVDYYLLHQANRRIVDSARTRLGQPAEKFPVNINRTGNTSSASIPILLDEMRREGRIKTGDTLLLSAFGAGMTAGTCVLKWE